MTNEELLSLIANQVTDINILSVSSNEEFSRFSVTLSIDYSPSHLLGTREILGSPDRFVPEIVREAAFRCSNWKLCDVSRKTLGAIDSLKIVDISPRFYSGNNTPYKSRVLLCVRLWFPDNFMYDDLVREIIHQAVEEL